MKAREPKWLEAQAILILHREGLEEHGGLDGIRDHGLLESAMARPANLFHYENVTDLPRLAASYGYGIARNHPFNDGNKRAAFLAAVLFLKINGRKFYAPQVLATQTIVQLASGELSEEVFANWLALHSEAS
jgi:death on curing protein